MTEQTIPQDLEQKLVQINKEIIKKVNQGADKDKTRRNEVLEALEKLFLATPLEYLEVVHDQTIYLPFQYFNFYNKWFTPENAPDPEGYHFEDWVVNGTKDIKFIQRNLGQKLESILEQIGRYSTLGLLKDGIGSIAEKLRRKYGEEIAGRYLSIIKSRFDQSFRERDLSIGRYLHEPKQKQHSPIEKRKQLNVIGRMFRGYIKQTFEFVNGLPTLFNGIKPEFYSILFQEPAPIEQTYQDFADFVIEANRKLVTLRDSLNKNKKYETEKLFSLLSEVGGREFYEQSFLDNVIRLVGEKECKSEEELLIVSKLDLPDYTPIKLLAKGGYSLIFLIKSKTVMGRETTHRMGVIKIGDENFTSSHAYAECSKLGGVEKIISDEYNYAISLCEIADYSPTPVPQCWGLQKGTFEKEGRIGIVYQFIKGKNLSDFFKDEGININTETRIKIARGIIKAVAYLHDPRSSPQVPGLIHRDIRPNNFIWDEENIYIIDYGLSCSSKLKLIAAGQREYVSPEQYRDEPSDQSSDNWSLGIVLYEVFTGFIPSNIRDLVRGKHFKEIRIEEKDVEKIKQTKGTRSGIPYLYNHLIMEKLLKFLPQDRFQNAVKVWEYINRK